MSNNLNLAEKTTALKKHTVEKGKRGLFSVVFGRTFVVILLLLLQMGVLFLGFNWLSEYMIYAYGGTVLLTALLVIFLINKRENPAFMIAWMIPMLLVPIFGILLYVFCSIQQETKILRRRLEKLDSDNRNLSQQKPAVMLRLEEDNPSQANLSRYLGKMGFPTYQNTSAKYFPSGETKFEEMKIQLEKAKSFIFMEYFIVAKGYMWDSILEILEAKVKEGVEVRFMYDGMCSLSLLPYHYPEELKKKGIQCRMFSPIRPVLSTVQNNRDHRKILVIDGQVAFTGGVNLADEYINQKERFGHWKDTAIMLQGEAVRSFTLMFLKMWNTDKRIVQENFAKYINIPIQRTPEKGDGYVIPYSDMPLDEEILGEQVYIDILFNAQRYVHIMTPYLILDYEMLHALTYAAKRGVEVIIIMPHIPDKKYAFILAKTYYEELLEAGVQIYEYTPGFVHAKVFVSDDCKAVVGTINLDYRSLYLHFECAAMLYRNKEIPNIEKDFQETLTKCQKVMPGDVRREGIKNVIAGRVLRLFAPLM
ncbi:MAG: cardiolipin synthase [Lachnospiraceae bacterium]|nr:cardiolipin synthase [Lachnospiraceae bacterium]